MPDNNSPAPNSAPLIKGNMDAKNIRIMSTTRSLHSW